MIKTVAFTLGIAVLGLGIPLTVSWYSHSQDIQSKVERDHDNYQSLAYHWAKDKPETVGEFRDAVIQTHASLAMIFGNYTLFAESSNSFREELGEFAGYLNLCEQRGDCSAVPEYMETIQSLEKAWLNEVEKFLTNDILAMKKTFW